MDSISKTSIILCLLLFVSACTQSQEPTPNKTYCSTESISGDVCSEVAEPVCGWYNENINCIVYPCAQTYNNSCFACKDSQVVYWTDGSCPKFLVQETTTEPDEFTQSVEELDSIKDL